MATARPFAYNTGTTIPDMQQSGDLAIGPLTGSTHRYDLGYGEVKWYMGANEDLGYIIGRPIDDTQKPTFLRSAFTEQGYLDLVNYLYLRYGGGVTPFNNTLDAENWVNNEGYWQTYTGGTGPSPTPTPSTSMVPTPTPTPTPSATPPINLNKFSIDFSGTTINNLQAGSGFVGGDNSEWDMGDGNTLTTVNSTFDHTYVNPYLEPVAKTIEFTTDDLAKLSTLYIQGTNNTTLINKVYGVDFSNITGTTNLQIYNNEINSLDLSSFSGMSGSVSVYNNPQLRELNMPTQLHSTASNLTYIALQVNPQITEIDLSALTKLGGTLNIHGNTLLETLTFPTTLDGGTTNFSTFEVRSNASLTGELDLSAFTKIGNVIYIYSNTLLTGVKFPASYSGYDVNRLYLHSNNLTGNLDVSVLDELGGYVNIYSNSNLTGITFANTLQSGSININTFNLRSNGLLGTLDLSMFTKMGRYVYIYSNTELKKITFPASLDAGATNISNLRISHSDLDDLDLSMFTKLGSTLFLGYDASLTGITFPASIDAGANNFTSITISDTEKLEDLNISPLTKIGGTLSITDHDVLTGMTFPASVVGNNITSLNFYNNIVIETVDFSSLTKLGGNMNMFSCSNLQEITFPASIDSGATNITNMGFQNCDLRDNLDVSMFTKIAGNFRTYSSSNLTGVTFTNSLDSGANNLTLIGMNSCDLRSLDLSGLVKSRNTWQSNGTQSFSFSNNPNLTSVQFPSVLTGSTLLYFVNRIYFSDCSLDQTSVDDLLAKMLEFYNAVTPVGGTCTVLLNNPTEGSNALPSAQGYSDISDLQTIFTNASLTLTITLNT